VILLAATGAAAQTVTGSGTSGTVPQFTGSSTLGNSPISISGSNVGIGTTNPAAKLEVNLGNSSGWSGELNALNIVSPDPLFSLDLNSYIVGSGIVGFQLTPTAPSGSAAGMVITTQGNVGLGTTTPGNPLNVYTGGGSTPVGAMSIDVGSFSTPANASASYFFRVRDIGGSSTPFYIQGNGNVGIGTTNPGVALEVNGTAQVDGALNVGNGGIVFPNGGGTQTIAYTGVTCGGDYAESVDVSGDRTHYQPGDVLVLDADNPGKMLKSIEAYSTSVSGIYSTKPGTVGRRQTTEKSPDEVPMAVVGIVPAKVSAENGPVKVGDLLVTSSTPGYAMKGTDRSRMLGAVVGKAMAKLDSGTGVIEVLVTLQ